MHRPLSQNLFICTVFQGLLLIPSLALCDWRDIGDIAETTRNPIPNVASLTVFEIDETPVLKTKYRGSLNLRSTSYWRQGLTSDDLALGIAAKHSTYADYLLEPSRQNPISRSAAPTRLPVAKRKSTSAFMMASHKTVEPANKEKNRENSLLPSNEQILNSHVQKLMFQSNPKPQLQSQTSEPQNGPNPYTRVAKIWAFLAIAVIIPVVWRRLRAFAFDWSSI